MHRTQCCIFMMWYTGRVLYTVRQYLGTPSPAHTWSRRQWRLPHHALGKSHLDALTRLGWKHPWSSLGWSVFFFLAISDIPAKRTLKTKFCFLLECVFTCFYWYFILFSTCCILRSEQNWWACEFPCAEAKTTDRPLFKSHHCGFDLTSIASHNCLSHCLAHSPMPHTHDGSVCMPY